MLLLFGGAFFAFSLSSAPGAAGWAVLAGAVTQVCACSGALQLPRCLGLRTSWLRCEGWQLSEPAETVPLVSCQPAAGPLTIYATASQ